MLFLSEKEVYDSLYTGKATIKYKNKHIKVIICIDTLNLLSIIYTTS